MLTEEPQYEAVAQSLAERIRHGDYNLRRFPGTRMLADEFRVSHMVARQAVSKLVADGVLTRPNKSRQPVPVSAAKKKAVTTLAFLAPAYTSPLVDHLRRALTHSASRAGLSIQSIEYGHWHDPVIFDALRSLPNAFLVGHGHEIPQSIAHRLGTEGYRIATTLDLLRYDIPRLTLFDRRGIDALLDHLRSLGHRVVDCLNVQPANEILQSRMNDWKDSLQDLNLAGRLINHPVEVYERTVSGAYNLIHKLIDAGEFNSTALFCTTEEAAIGVTRALRDRNLRVPNDVSIVTISDIGLGAFVHPSLTAIELPDVREPMNLFTDWLAHPDSPWSHPLDLHPATPELRVAESTGKASEPKSL